MRQDSCRNRRLKRRAGRRWHRQRSRFHRRTTPPGRLRGWLLCRMAGLDFDEARVDPDDVDYRQELLLLSPSVRVPRLTHDEVAVWDTLAIAEYLNETFPKAGLYPAACGETGPLPGDLGRDAFGLLQPALRPADEPQGAAQELQDLLGRAPGCRPHQVRSGTNVSTLMAVRSCSARRPRSRMRCSPRSAPAFAPTRSTWPRRLPPIRPHPRLGADAGMDRRRAVRTRRDHRTRSRILNGTVPTPLLNHTRT